MDTSVDVTGVLAPQRIAVGYLGSVFITCASENHIPDVPIGPCYVGWALQIFLAGVCCSSFTAYVREGRLATDRLNVKVSVLVVVVLNTTLAILCGEATFHWGTTQARSS